MAQLNRERTCFGNTLVTVGLDYMTSHRSYYEILGISRSATSRQIRSAYRKLARQYHPDLHPEDKAAAEKFRELQEAYDVLGDARKRKAYDYYGPNFGERVPVAARETVRSQVSSVRVPRDFSRTIPRPSGGADSAKSGNALAGGLVYRLGFIAAVVVVCVLGAVIYVLLPSSGTREFRRAREALRHVQSVKVRGVYTIGGDYLDEISCPASDRLTQHVQSMNVRLSLVTLTIASDVYRYNNRSEIWTHDRMAISNASSICSPFSRGEDAMVYFPFGKWLDGPYDIEKEDLRTTPDGTCREWSVRQTVLGIRRETNLVCLDVKTHLPMFEGAPNTAGEVRFFDWNVPIDLRPPAAATMN
jgi:hypothetical protein